MKYCPKCQANVEGLINHCDCCGASLDTRRRLFFCEIYDVPACIGFSAVAFKILEEMETLDPMQFDTFLEKIVFSLVCYPSFILENSKIKSRVYYSPKKKLARITIVVDYNEYVHANQDKKAVIVANAIWNGINMLQNRLSKKKLSIEEVVTKANKICNKLEE